MSETYLTEVKEVSNLKARIDLLCQIIVKNLEEK